MTVFVDARIPVRLGRVQDAGPGLALLLPVGTAAPEGAVVARIPAASPRAHPAGCACCASRGRLAEALGRLFLARARGEVAFFREVIAVLPDAQDQAELGAALAADPLLAARYRPA